MLVNIWTAQKNIRRNNTANDRDTHTHCDGPDNLKCIHNITNWHCTVIGDDRGRKLDFWPFSIEMKNGGPTIHIARKLHCKTLFSFVTHKHTHHPKLIYHLKWWLRRTFPSSQLRMKLETCSHLKTLFFAFNSSAGPWCRMFTVELAIFFGQFACSKIQLVKISCKF